MAAPEVAPFARTGRLADVVGALATALQAAGARTHVVLPAYRAVDSTRLEPESVGELAVATGGVARTVAVRTVRAGGVPVSFVVADEYFARAHLYGDLHGDYADNAERFAFFARAVLALAERLEPPPDVLHCFDWQTALVPVFARAHGDALAGRTRTILTFQDLAYQGLFPASVWPLLGLDWSYFTPRHLEFYGQVNFLKGGLVTADLLTTVSRRYAREILESEQGHGLDGVLRERRVALRGILNGVDGAVWNPADDPHLAAPFDRHDPSGKARCKAALQQALGLRAAPRIPLLGVVAPPAKRNGSDVLRAALPELVRQDLQLVLLTGGDPRSAAPLTAEAKRAPERVAVRPVGDDALTHRIHGGADLLLFPSRSDPGGLTQVEGMRYGAVPVALATGALDDTVSEFDPATGTGNGFKFAANTAPALLEAVRRALAVYHRPADWRRLVHAALACDLSWAAAARHYLALYGEAIAAGRDR
jgi:starch synthase